MTSAIRRLSENATAYVTQKNTVAAIDLFHIAFLAERSRASGRTPTINDTAADASIPATIKDSTNSKSPNPCWY
jgi:hypothetical protein